MKRYLISDSVIINLLGNDIIIFDNLTEKTFQIKGIAKDVIKLLQKKEMNRDELVRNIIKKYDVSLENCQRDIEKILMDLIKKQILK